MHPEKFKSWLSELLQEKGVDIFRSKARGCADLRVCLVWLVALLLAGRRTDANECHQPTAACVQGVICLDGVASKCAFQGVHMLCDMAELESKWGADEERVNQLVFIGRNLDRAELEAAVTACLTKR